MADFFNNSIEGFQDLLKQITAVKKELLEIANINKKAVSGINPAEAKAEDIKKLEQAEKNLIATEKEIIKVSKEELKFAKQLSFAKSQQGKIRAENQILLAKEKKITKELAKESLGLTTAYQKESKRLNDLRNKFKDLSLGTDKQRQAAQKLLPQITKLDTKLKAIDKSVGQNFRSVGNYSGALSSLTPVLGTFGSKLNSIQAGLTSLKGGFKAMSKTQDGAAKSSKALRFAMLAIPIFAIIAAITALISVFAGTQRGMDAITKVTRPLTAIFQRFLGLVEDLSFFLVDKFKEALDDPIQAIKDLGNLILENIINRFKSFLVLGEAIALLLKGKFKEATKKGADALIQFNTGITDGTDKMAKFGKSMFAFVSLSVLMGQALDNLIKKFERLELASIIPLAKARLEFQKLREIANDVNETAFIRVQALIDAEKQQRFITAREKELLDLRIDALKLQLSFNKTLIEEKKELALLEAEKLNSEAAAQKKINSLVSLRSGIEKKALAETEKELRVLNKIIAARDKAFSNRLESERELIKKVAKVNTEETDRLEALEVAAIERRRAAAFKLAKDITGNIGNELLERNKMRVDSLKEEGSVLEEERKRQRDRADQGLSNSLAQQEALIDKNRIEQLEEEKKAANIKEAQRLAELFISLKESEAKIDPQGSTGRALAGVAESKAIAQAIKLTVSAFEKGGLVEGDEQLIRINEKGQEFVLDASTTKAMGLDKSGSNMGDFKNIMSMHEMKQDRVMQDSKGDYRIIQSLDNVVAAINNKEVYEPINFDKFGNLISVMKGKVSIKKTFKTGNRL